MAPSLPGFGESDRPQEVSAYSLESLARCMLGLLDHLKIAKVGTVILGTEAGKQPVARHWLLWILAICLVKLACCRLTWWGTTLVRASPGFWEWSRLSA